jgi:hypothetical protein
MGRASDAGRNWPEIPSHWKVVFSKRGKAMSDSKTEVKATECTENNAPAYQKPEVKTLSQRDIAQAVNKGSKFPARGFAG